MSPGPAKARQPQKGRIALAADSWKHFSQRAEPWLLLLAILAILFVPGVKGINWLLLILLAIGNTIRRWREAWTWFSTQSMGEMLRAALWVPGLILLYFALHAYAPQFVHTSPSTAPLEGRHKLVVNLERPGQKSLKQAWLFLRVRRKRGRIDLFGQVFSRGAGTRILVDFHAVASFGDYIRSSLHEFRAHIPLHILSGQIPWTDPPQALGGRGWIGFTSTGSPLHIQVRTDSGLLLQD